MFQQQTAAGGVAADWLRSISLSQTGVAEMIGYYASFTDLLVVSQPLTADMDKQHAVITSPERLLISSGRPVLIIPVPDISHLSVSGYGRLEGRSQGLSCDARRHAPAASGQVCAYGLCRPTTFSPDEGERLSRYLALHNVSADMELIPTGDLSVGDTLLNQVSDDKIDLLILGVHITTRRGRLDMGAVCRHLLGR